jgi:hypothetical protein
MDGVILGEHSTICGKPKSHNKTELSTFNGKKEAA